ncbi:MAG TPA: NTP transferase domain-containing protein [Actinomycetales bacterium]
MPSPRAEPDPGHTGRPVLLHHVVVLAGGRSARLGEDKTTADLGGTTVLDRLLDGLAEQLPGVPVTAVGPWRPTTLDVTWVREEPPGGGPVAALAAALWASPPPSQPDVELLAVVAGDHPFAAPAVPHLAAALVASGAGVDAAVGVDATGRLQLLLGVHRGAALRAVVAGLATGDDGVGGRPVRSVVERLRVQPVPLQPRWTLDVDTAHDLARARALVADEL